MDFIAKRACKVLVADHGSPSPLPTQDPWSIVSTLKGAGFAQVFGYTGIEGLRKSLFQNYPLQGQGKTGETDPQKNPAWCILGIGCADDIDQAFGLLRDLQQDLRGAPILVTFIVDKADQTLLPDAFALGLWTWMSRPLTPISFVQEIQHLSARLSAQECDTRLLAAEYLRRYLVEAQDWGSLMALEETLTDYYYNQPQLLLHLAEAQILGGRLDDGVAALKRAQFYDRKLEKKALALLTRYGQSESRDREMAKGALPFKNAVIVDQDTAIIRALTEALHRGGVKEIVTFEDGMVAWEAMRTMREPSLLISEWRMQGLTGPALIQRMRGYGFIDVPIVILSSLLKPTDGGLLTEMSVANVIAKPLAKADLLTALEWTAIQERLPSEIRSMERRILAMLKAGKRQAAQRLKDVYMVHEEVSLGEQKYMDAEFYFDQGQYQEAKLAAIESIKLLGKSSLLPLNLLGKCLLKLKDFDAALRILEQARQISPENLGRILDLAELHLNRNDTDKAFEMVSKARSIDPTLERIDSIEARVHIVAHRTKKALELIQKMESLSEIVGYMNNHAVALAQVGKFADAVTLYKNTLDSLPTENYGRPDRAHARLVVTYNLALCLCRQQELQTAVDVLQPVAATPDLEDPVVKKAGVLLQKINKSLESGVTLNFSSAQQGEAGGLPAKSQNFASVLLDTGGTSVAKSDPLGPCLAGLFKVTPKSVSSLT